MIFSGSVQVFWSGERKWYRGRVAKWRHSDRHHFIRFEDGDERWYNMRKQKYEVIHEFGE
jgi:hypothetical protein